MKTPTEKLLENIEESFNKLNTSVELINKAENIATNSLQTSKTLISEFKSTSENVGQLIKEDFNNQYNKVHELNSKLIDKINEFDFQNVKTQITELRKTIETNRLADKTSIDTTEAHAIANNQFLDKFQNHTFPELSSRISELRREINDYFLRNSNQFDVLENRLKDLDRALVINHKKSKIQFYIILLILVLVLIKSFINYSF